MEYSDFPLYTEFDKFIDELEGSLPGNFGTSSLEQQCTFCNAPAEYENDSLLLFACIGCYCDINDEEVDFAEPGDHPISKKYHQDFRNIINRSYDTNGYYDEMELYPHPCFVCNQVIDYGEIFMTYCGDKHAIAHVNCFEKQGFTGFFTDEDYRSIISDAEEKISEGLEEGKSRHLIPRTEPCDLTLVRSLQDRQVLNELFSNYHYNFRNEESVKKFLEQWKVNLHDHQKIIRQMYFTHNPIAPGGSYPAAKRKVLDYICSITFDMGFNSLIDQHYWRSFPKTKLKGIKHNVCSFCNQPLHRENDPNEICVSGNGLNWALAHWECGENPFSPLFTEEDYESITERLEDELIHVLLQ